VENAAVENDGTTLRSKRRLQFRSVWRVENSRDMQCEEKRR